MSVDYYKTSVVFTWSEYKSCLDQIKCSDRYGRRSFLARFHNLLTIKLQEISSIKCLLAEVYNYIKPNDNAQPYWTGSYVCAQNDKSRSIKYNCSIKFKCSIQIKPAEDTEVTIVILFTGLSKHPIICSKAWLRNEKRISMATEIISKGVTNVYNQLIIKNSNEQNEPICTKLSFSLIALMLT
jgi:hypothetical protein